MRLTVDGQLGIAAAANPLLSPGSRVGLFGARVDDSRRGGGVGLWGETVTHKPPNEVVRLRGSFTAQLHSRLGARRIDVLVCTCVQIDGRAVVVAARRDGVELAQT